MKLARALLRVLVACVFSAWVLLLWSGINLWQVGIQQQIDGWKIHISQTLIGSMLEWYHILLGYC